MAAIDYPSTIPCMLSGSLDEATVEPWVGDQGEVGAVRRRKRFTRALRMFTYSLHLTTIEKDLLFAFYDETLDDGVAEFNWTHPFTSQVYEVRFTGRPSLKHRYNSRWSVDVSLEEI